MSSTVIEEESNDCNLIKEEFFHDILEKKYGKYVILKFGVEKGSGAGENYVSIMFRVLIEIKKADGKSETMNFIAKMIPSNAPNSDFLKKLAVFEKEAEMYEYVLPKFEQIFREHGESVNFAPKYWKTMQEPKLLIMEDLKVREFENMDRRQGLNLMHTEATLSKLAQYHAASACVYEKFGPFSESLMSGMYTAETTPILRDIQPTFWSSMYKVLQQWTTCTEYMDRIGSFSDRVVDLSMEAFAVNPDEFNVLAHGDLWANNVMYQHGSNGEIKDVSLVDFQMCKWGPPVQDLLYFIISSASNDIKVERFDHLIRHYHSELIGNLKLLGYCRKMPKLVDLHVQLYKRGFLGILACFGVMSAALLEPTENATMDNYLSDSEDGNKFRNHVYMNPRFIKACEILLPFFEIRGLLDI